MRKEAIEAKTIFAKTWKHKKVRFSTSRIRQRYLRGRRAVLYVQNNVIKRPTCWRSRAGSECWAGASSALHMRRLFCQFAIESNRNATLRLERVHCDNQKRVANKRAKGANAHLRQGKHEFHVQTGENDRAGHFQQMFVESLQHVGGLIDALLVHERGEFQLRQHRRLARN